MSYSPRRYDAVSVFLHWSIALGIIVIAAVELLRGELFPRGSAIREALKALHDPAGTVVFALVLVRLVWRSTHAAPGMPDGMHPWQRLAAKLTHFALYFMMVAIPLTGMAATFARGRPIHFGLFQIPMPPVGTFDRATARTIKDVHGFLSDAILMVAFVHAGAALWHHYVRKDDVLVRMLPSRSSLGT